MLHVNMDVAFEVMVEAMFQLCVCGSLQDFDPEYFSSTLMDDGLDRSQMQQLMSSSHMPYILNRLNVSLSCLLYTSPSPRDATLSRMPSSA